MNVIQTSRRIVPFLILLFSTHASAAIDQSALISGFAKWQADRVERIVLDNTLRDIADDKYVSRFFPSSSSVILDYQQTSSKRLLPLLDWTIKQDVNSFEIIARCAKDVIEEIKNIELDSDNYIQAIKENKNDLKSSADKLKAIYEGIHRLREKTQTAPYNIENFRTEICGGYEEVDLSKKKATQSDIPAEVDSIQDSSGQNEKANVKKMPEGESKLQKVDVEAFSKALAEHFASEQPNIEENSESQSPSVKKVKEDAKKAFVEFLNKNGLKGLYDLLKDFNFKEFKKERYVVKVHFILKALQVVGIEETDFSAFKKLQNTAILFASLGDAASEDNKNAADQVKGVLDAFIDEQGVYNSKYNGEAVFKRYFTASGLGNDGKLEKKNYSSSCFTCRDKIFIGSYYSLAMNTSGDTAGDFRAFGPVGLEVKLFNFESGVMSLNFAPIDLGNIITNELREKEYTARFEDLKSPSYFFSWSFKRKPLAVKFGYQEDINLGNDLETNSWFIAFGFDLPVWTLY